MKILLPQSIFYVPTYGGENRVNRLLLESLAAKGHTCRVVAPAFDVRGPTNHGQFLDELAKRGITVLRSGDGVDVYRLNGVEVHAVRQGRRIHDYAADQIREYEPTWVMVSSLDPGQLLLGTSLRACPGRVVYTAHTPQLFPFGPASFAPNPGATQLLSRVAAIWAIGRQSADYIAEHTGRKATMVHPPVYGRGPFANYGGFGKGFITIINPSQVKGICIFSALARRFPKRRFGALLGWATTEQDRRNLAGLGNVQLWDTVKDIDEVLAKTGVLLVPSLYREGFGLVAVEAMVRAIPVLASNFGGLIDAKLGIDYLLPVRPIEQYEKGFDDRGFPIPVIPNQDVVPWAEALQKLLSDREHYDELSAASAEAARRFVSEAEAQKFEDFLANLAPADRSQTGGPGSEARPRVPQESHLSRRIKDLSRERRALLALRMRRAGSKVGSEDG